MPRRYVAAPRSARLRRSTHRAVAAARTPRHAGRASVHLLVGAGLAVVCYVMTGLVLLAPRGGGAAADGGGT
ncbi:hypothetical protein ACF1DY_25860 [Streptomyces albus]